MQRVITTTGVRQLHPFFVGELAGVDVRTLDEHGIDEIRTLYVKLMTAMK